MQRPALTARTPGPLAAFALAGLAALAGPAGTAQALELEGSAGVELRGFWNHAQFADQDDHRFQPSLSLAPVLEHDTLRLAQSGVILDYLADQLGRFGPRDAAERREILCWLLYDNHKLTSYTATYRSMRQFVKEPDQAVMAEFRQRAEYAWGVLNAHLQGRRYVAADRLTIADLSLCGYLFWPDELGVDWDTYPNVRDWLERIRAEPRWVHPYALMPGHPRLEA